MFRQLHEVVLYIACCGCRSSPPNSAYAHQAASNPAAAASTSAPAASDPAAAATPAPHSAVLPLSTSDLAAVSQDLSTPGSSSTINQHLLSIPPDLTDETLGKLIDHLQQRIDSGSSLQGSYLEWEKYTSINVPDLLQQLKEKSVVTAKGVVKDTVLPLLVEILKAAGSLNWAALGFSMLAWGIEQIDKLHENFEDCLFLLKNTLFLLIHTRKMWAQEERMSLGSHEDHLLKSNLPRIVEAAVKASVVCASCGLNSESTSKMRRYLDMARTFLGAPSLEASIGKLKEEIRDLMLQNGLAVQELIVRRMQNSNVRRQLSGYKTLPQNYRPDMTEEIQRMLGVESEEIIAVCIHGMGGVGKTTLALHVLMAWEVWGKPLSHSMFSIA